MIERAYTVAEAMGIAVWCEDEAGPYGTIPYPGASWQPESTPACYSHEYAREGTAKLITLFHPKTGEVRVKGVTNTRNTTLHEWLQTELTAILTTLPEPKPLTDPHANRLHWESWREGLTVKASLLSEALPPLRLLLVMDNLAGHKNVDWMIWCFRHGILPIFTPLGGSWLNMAESIQRILKRRALDGFHPHAVQTIIDRLEAVARGWNADPTPFIWNGKRRTRRDRARQRLHAVSGSGAATSRPIQRLDKWRSACQLTH